MRIGLMQPYFFPYLGYFELVARCDRWIAFDTAQYIQRGWVNRNRMLHQEKEWQYITVPVKKHPLETPIRDVEIAADIAWKEAIVGQLQHYKRHAPYFKETMALLSSCLDDGGGGISALNIRCLKAVCTRLEINTPIDVLSEMKLTLEAVNAPDEWALNVARALGANSYINPPGGKELYSDEKFRAHNVELIIQDFQPLEYTTGPFQFIANLSILDVLMWNAPETVRAHMNREQG